MANGMRPADGFIVSLLAVFFCALLVLAQAGCSRGPSLQGASTLVLQSSSFSGDTIPNKYSSCNGQNDMSPELSWSALPARTQSFALIVIDKDSLFGYSFLHWLLYDIPADKRELPEGIEKQADLTDGSRQGSNDFNRIGYVGPCPPGKSTHHYAFTLYALDTRLNLPLGASEMQVRKAMNGHVLAVGQLIAHYKH